MNMMMQYYILPFKTLYMLPDLSFSPKYYVSLSRPSTCMYFFYHITTLVSHVNLEGLNTLWGKKWENDGYQYFPLFPPTKFSKIFFLRVVLKLGIVW